MLTDVILGFGNARELLAPVNVETGLRLSEVSAALDLVELI